MMTEALEERREYYRIDDRIALEILPADSPAAAPSPLFALLAELHQLEAEAQPLLRQLGDRNRTLANYLKLQNRRIDLLGQALAQELLHDVGTPQPVILSEGGLRFDHGQALEPGRGLVLKMVLLPQALGLQIKARVLYCNARDDGQFDIGTEFEELSDPQRQLLARHILQKQALERRLARNSPQGA
ncbi:PilZ domain-containing protein [Stutzerimonas tarimensis]|uniref:PilZ domain-containing protein n=1 Tax=Stutzerimonas tarimensis TaxID=1507735 RepID=A0ABV7T0C9_9GAMM